MDKIQQNILVGNTRLTCLEDNTYLFESTGKILEIEELDGHNYLVLDNTIFYPQGGGQPSDTGTVFANNTSFVVNKCVIIDDKVYHFGAFSKGNFNVDERVTIIIDEQKRRLYAKIHSAGHVLDIALETIGLNLKSNKGYHFPEGPYVEYIGEIVETEEVILNIEEACNVIITKGGRVSYEISPDKHTNGKPNRIMSIEGYSDCPCGGTHVQNLKEIGHIKIRKIKNKKGLVRVSYEVD
jgi:Ser-tRNA(Ala) deacylase AlaX